MPNIILKKTLKIKPSGFQIKNEKSFSLHGSIPTNLVAAINQRLATIRGSGKAKQLQFNMDSNGHYYAEMNHDFQKYNEEDAIVAILDVMEDNGWTFRFQYDSETASNKVSGSSYTARELFIFHKPR